MTTFAIIPPHVAKPERPNLPSDDQLVLLVLVGAEMAREVWPRAEVLLLKAGLEGAAEPLEAVEIVVLRSPLGRVQVVLLGRLLVEQVPAELVQDQHALGREQPAQLVEDGVEIVDMVQREARDDRVERAGLVQLLDRRPPEDRPVRSLRVHRDHVVARHVQRESQLAAAAAHFEDSSWGRRQL